MTSALLSASCRRSPSLGAVLANSAIFCSD
jgi:hypothetical protein